MTTVLVLYEKAVDPRPWVPLLQHEALLAASRAILSHDRSEEPARSEHVLLVPANLDILPLLATAARDFATFAEPEGRERPTAPIVLYEDGTLEEMPEDMDEMQLLFHPAWFERPRLGLQDTVAQRRPEVCVVLGDLRRTIIQRGEVLRNVGRIVYFEHLTTSGLEGVPANLRERLIAADRRLQDRVERGRSEGEHPSQSLWESMRLEGEELDLEPFVAFGAAIEMTILSEDRD
jgi:hypothetical protein